jgi:predicted metal-binding membrane protein
MDSGTSTPLLRYSSNPFESDNNHALRWSIGSLAFIAWIALWLWDRSPYSRYLSHQELGQIGSAGTPSVLVIAGLYVFGWTLMTIAMMLPTTLPLLSIFRRLIARREDRTRLLLLLVLGYLAVWLGFGIAAHTADWMLHELAERSAWLEANAWSIGAATLLVAGAFQFSRLKYKCLEKCRTPLTFVTEYWRGRDDSRNAFLLGVNHGIFCVGCCWALMLLMFGVGIGNIGWMLGLGTVMAIEKNMRWGKRISAPVGVALLGSGAFLIVNRLYF